jgi:uncharacterized ParB-like nuclease family protein
MTTVTTLFVADERVETWLKGLEVDFTGPVAIAIDLMDFNASKQNQARPEALVEDVPESYATAIAHGDQLPALVVYNKNGKYIIIDGNHRLSAAKKRKADRVMAYVVSPETTSETIMLLTMSANARNGQAVSKSWKLQQSVTLLAHGYNEDSISKALSVPVSSIQTFRRAQTVDARAARMRITGWTDLPAQTREAIGRLTQDSVFQFVADASVSVRPSVNAEFRSFINELKRAPSEAEALEQARAWATVAIADARERRRKGFKRTPHVRNLKTGLVTGIGKINAFNVHELNAAFATDEDRAVLKSVTRTALKRLMDIHIRISGAEETENEVLGMLEEIAKD